MRIRNINWGSFKLTWAEAIVLGIVTLIVGDEMTGRNVHKHLTGRHENTASNSITSNEINAAPIPLLADTDTDVVQESIESFTEENQLEDK